MWHPIFSLRFLTVLIFVWGMGNNGMGQTPFPEMEPIFKDDIVSRIDIIISSDSLLQIFAPGNEESDHHYTANFIFDNGEIRDTVDKIGFRLRGNTSRFSAKKSFKVSFNTYEAGRKWHNIEKLNLNGEHNDPTVMRSKLCWDLLRDFRIPAPRASYSRLYINSQYYGIYANVEHIDEEFVRNRFGNNDGNLYKCLWPADLDYLGDDPDIYKFDNGSRRAYDLKTNEDEDDYSDLARFIDILNNTSVSERQCELENVFNVDSYLRAMAFDILTGNWDGPLYNKNNFYLYHNVESGQFEYIPYDLDNTFGIDWFQVNWAERNIYTWGHPDQPRPLFWSILEVEEYKNRFSYYMNKFLGEIYTEDNLYNIIDNLKSLIRPSIEEDPYYRLDYGYTLNDFDKSFDQSLSTFHTPIGLKTFINKRISASLAQLQVNNISPIISNIKNIYPNKSKDVAITAMVEDDLSIANVELCYKWDDSDQDICVEMYDDGQHEDISPQDNYYGGSITTDNRSGLISYFVRSLDINGNTSRKPHCGYQTIEVENSSITLAINEVMADNVESFADEFGEYDDWIEVFNYGMDQIFLGDFYLSDKKDQPAKWAIPEIWIQPGEYLIFWADEDEDQGQLHTNFKLNAGGEFVGIFDTDDNDNRLIDGIKYGILDTDVAYGRKPNGTGSFQLLVPTPGAPNASTTSTDDNYIFNIIRAYPNPFDQFLFIEHEQKANSGMEVVVFNALGKVVLKQSLGVLQMINTTLWGKGLYIIAIRKNGELLHLEKVIKSI